MAAGLLERILAPRIGALNAFDDRYWTPSGGTSAAGINVTPELALTYSAFYACVAVIAEDESTLPLPVFRRNGEARIQLPGHRAQYLLNEAPNDAQTAQEWREWMTAVAAMRGEALSRIVPGRAGFADQLQPMPPDDVTKEKIPSGALRYRFSEQGKPVVTLLADEVFRLPGRMGMSVVTLARETLGAAIAGDRFTSAMWRNGIRPRMGLQHPGRLSQEAQERLAATIDDRHGGAANAGKTVVFEEGMTWVKIGIDPADAQFLESRQFSVEEVCRWFRMQPHKIAHLLRATFSNIEHQAIEHVVDTMRPWCVRWEQAIDRQLIVEPDVYARHNMAALLRGDSLTQAQAFEVYRRMGVTNANEIRALLEMNPRADPGGDTYWDTQPGTGSAQQPAQNGTANSGRARVLALSAAARVVQRETTAMMRKAGKYATAGEHDTEAFDAWRVEVETFYAEHRAFVVEQLHIDADLAGAYCTEKAAEILREGVSAIGRWEQRDINGLADLALGEP